MVPNAGDKIVLPFAVLVTVAHDKALLQKTPDTFLEHVLLRGCIFIPYFFKSHVLFLLPAFDFKAPPEASAAFPDNHPPPVSHTHFPNHMQPPRARLKDPACSSSEPPRWISPSDLLKAPPDNSSSYPSNTGSLPPSPVPPSHDRCPPVSFLPAPHRLPRGSRSRRG